MDFCPPGSSSEDFTAKLRFGDTLGCEEFPLADDRWPKGRTAQCLIQTIRKAFGKEKYQFVTVSEFCLFTGIDEDTVREFLQD